MIDQQESEPEAPPAQCIGKRVDALTIAYRVEMTDETRDAIRRRSATVDAGSAELAIGQLVCALKRPRTRGAEKWPIENGDLRGLIEFHATAGWNVEITMRATYLATHTVPEAIALADAAAASFGEVKHTRLRRFDLAADFVHFPLAREDAEGFVIPRRGKLAEFRDACDVENDNDASQPLRRMYQLADATVTGFVVCPGGDVLSRIYDKSAELQLSGREEKRQLEMTTWARNGWTGEQVSRVEFQLRGTALDEMKLRNPHHLVEQLDAVWSYLTSRVQSKGLTWLRLCAPETATRRSRCDLDPRWAAVQGVIFVHESSPMRRTRRRGGATWPQEFGSMLSALAGQGDLGRVDVARFRHELLHVPEKERPDHARSWGLALLLDVHVTAAMHAHRAFFGAAAGCTDVAQDPDKPETGAVSPADVALDLAERVNGVWSRFRSVDDDGFPDHWQVESGSRPGELVLTLVGSSAVPPSRPPDRYDDDERSALVLGAALAAAS